MCLGSTLPSWRRRLLQQTPGGNRKRRQARQAPGGGGGKLLAALADAQAAALGSKRGRMVNLSAPAACIKLQARWKIVSTL